MFNKIAAYGAAAVLAAGAVGTAQAGPIFYAVGDSSSGSFGDAHIAQGDFTDTLAVTLTQSGLFSGSLTSAATALGKAGDLDFTSVVLTGASGSYDFTIHNNDNADGLTDSAVFTRFLDAGNYVLTISAHSFGNAQFGGNTTLSAAAVPEAATWMSMVLGFGLIGAAARRRKTNLSFA